VGCKRDVTRQAVRFVQIFSFSPRSRQSLPWRGSIAPLTLGSLALRDGRSSQNHNPLELGERRVSVLASRAERWVFASWTLMQRGEGPGAPDAGLASTDDMG
jgi:hypothetical protein